MIKNFIFDLGKVIVNFDPVELSKDYVKDIANIDRVSETVFSRVIFDKLDSGEFSDEDGRNYIIENCDSDILDEALSVYDNWMKNLKPIDGIADLIENLKNQGYKIYLLSNVSKGLEEEYRNIKALNNILKYFDGLVISGAIKMIKPNKEIYEYILDKFNLNAQECIFIDDKKENTDAAKRLLINAYTFDGDTEKLKNILKVKYKIEIL